MRKCQWGKCLNNAIKVVYRETTEEEKERTRVFNERGVSWAQLVELRVCDDHLQEAQNEYPFIANKEP